MNKVNNATYNSVVFHEFDTNDNQMINNTLSNLGLCLFVWDYKANRCFVNQTMKETFDIEINDKANVHKYLSNKLDDNSLLLFLNYIYQIRIDYISKDLEFPVKNESSIRWYSIKIVYNKMEDITTGIITLMEEKGEEVSSFHEESEYFEMLKNLPYPLYCYGNDGKLIYNNNKKNNLHQTIHNLIDMDILQESFDLNKIPNINTIEFFEETKNLKTYKINYIKRNKQKSILVTRTTFKTKNDDYVIFTHQPFHTEYTEENKLRKILRANELVMEIRDIVDHVDDLNEMFNYLLSKIHTVIPDASRSCILRLDSEDKLYLDSSYGFEDRYIDEFSLPFKESYACLHLKNDYTKSVIVDDIQRKYSDLFPDLKDEIKGFKIGSNVTTPLVIGDELYGIISVDSDENHVFDEVDLNLLDYIKIQIERAIIKYQNFRNIKKESTKDSLTGVSNRRHLMEVLSTFTKKADLESKEFLFVVFDLDKLKMINDTYGHSCGDKVIQQFSFIIENRIRETDFISRIGGDEFVGLFYNLKEDVLVNRITEWTNFFLKNPIDFKGLEVQTKFSYGISHYPIEGEHFSTLLELADKRMYKQKRSK